MKASRNKEYTLQITERQARLLSWACDRIARLIEGQDWTYQELMEEAWEKRCKKVTGNSMDKEWDGGWSLPDVKIWLDAPLPFKEDEV